jgi:threonine synthase
MARVVDLYGGYMDETGMIIREPDIERMRRDVTAVSVSDGKTTATIKDVYARHKIILEPHGAAGWAGLQQNFLINLEDATSETLSISLETAHPAKFPEEITKTIGIDPDLPDSMLGQDNLKEMIYMVENSYDKFKEFLKTNY